MGKGNYQTQIAIPLVVAVLLVPTCGCKFMAKAFVKSLTSKISSRDRSSRYSNLEYSDDAQKSRYKDGFAEQTQQAEFLRNLKRDDPRDRVEVPQFQMPKEFRYNGEL